MQFLLQQEGRKTSAAIVIDIHLRQIFVNQLELYVMTIKALPGLTLITLSLFSGVVFADESNSCEAAIQQLVKQQTVATNQLNTRLSILLDQQGHSAKQLNEIRDLQQQLGKQVTSQVAPPVFKNSSSKKDTSSVCVPAEPGKTTPDGKMILGETEWMYVEEANGNFLSRIDTGATTSSLSAQDVTVFEREGRRWVKFNIPVNDNKLVSVEAPFVKYIRIRQANGLEDRPIVRMTVRMGAVTEKADFSLTDRSNMDFPVLVGREFIKDISVVDVARENVQGKPKVPGAFEASEQYSPSQKKPKPELVEKAKPEPKAAPAPAKEKAPAAKKAVVDDSKPQKVDSAAELKPLADIEPTVKKEVKTATPADATPVKKPSEETEESDSNTQDK